MPPAGVSRIQQPAPRAGRMDIGDLLDCFDAGHNPSYGPRTGTRERVRRYAGRGGHEQALSHAGDRDARSTHRVTSPGISRTFGDVNISWDSHVHAALSD